MSEQKNDPLLDKGDVGEAGASTLHAIAQILTKAEDWEEAQKAAKRVALAQAAQAARKAAEQAEAVRKVAGSTLRTKVKQLDRALDRGASKAVKGIAKGLNPLEKAAALYEVGKLVASEDARQEARDSVEQMGRDPNVTALERFTQGFSDPFETMYGMKHWGRELGKAKKRARESGREAERMKRKYEQGYRANPEQNRRAKERWAKHKEDSRRAALLQARKENRK